MDGASHLQAAVWRGARAAPWHRRSEGLAAGEVSSTEQRNTPRPHEAMTHTLTRPKPPGPTRDPAMKYPLMTG